MCIKKEGKKKTCQHWRQLSIEDYIEMHEVGLITDARNDNDNTKSYRMTIPRKICKEIKSMGVLNE